MEKLKKLAPPLLLLFFCFFYGLWQSPGIGGGDAGDLVAAAVLKGVPHPPGYPLYTFLGWLLTKLPLGLTLAFRVGWLSSIPAAASVTLLYLITKKLTDRAWIGLVTSLSLAFNYLFWLQAEIQEVFALHLFFLFLSAYLLLVWLEKPRRKIIYLLSLVAGLEFVHHHTYLLIVPALAYVLLVAKKTRLKKNWFNLKFAVTTIFFFLLGAVFYFYVPWASAGNPGVNWGRVNDLDSLVGLVTRRDYGTITYTGGVSFSARRGLLALVGLGHFLVYEFTLPVMAAMALGAVGLFKKKRVLFNFVLIWLGLAGLFFQFWAGFPVSNWFSLATAERFYLLVYPALFILLAWGLKEAEVWFEKSSNLSPMAKKYFPKLLIGLAFFYPLWLLSVNLPKNDFRGFEEFEKYGRRFLNSCPENSVLIPSGDREAFSARYVYFVEGVRPDLYLLDLVVTGKLMLHENGIAGERYFFDADSQDPSVFWVNFAEFLKNNRLKVCTNYRVSQPGLVRHTSGLVDVYQYGGRPDSEVVFEKNRKIWDSFEFEYLLGQSSKQEAYFQQDLLHGYYRRALAISNYFLEVDEEAMSRFWLEKASQLVPNHEASLRLSFIIDIESQNCSAAEKKLGQFQAVLKDSESWVIMEALYEKECLGDAQKLDELQEKIQEFKATEREELFGEER